MLNFKKVEDLQQYLEDVKQKRRSIGFIPTMGALHDGHLSLIKRAKEETSCVVVCIFVNPTQFNDTADLDKYPRTIANDILQLTSVETDVLFFPDVEEVYPKGLNTKLELDFGQLATVMEGEFRPGHFDGMAQVVNRLLEIVKPNKLFMGQKDFQQAAIVRSMLKQTESNTELIICPIVREMDGLAMSSRNVRLTTENRKNAPKISKLLIELGTKIKRENFDKLKEEFAKEINSLPEFKLEYIDIVDGITLQSVDAYDDSDFIVVCIATWAGKIRLIDNYILKENQD